jgi:hypothetical protein
MVALPTTISPTVAAIDQAVQSAEIRDFDHVVRGSSIGHPCERHLFYRFRWAHHGETFDGRKLRLFQTGHVEEDRLVAYLRMAGVAVEAVDPATGEQWEVVSLDGHFKGHLDGICSNLLEAPATPHLLECKTHNAKSFAQLVKFGVSASKPEHVAQMQVYMHLKSLSRAFYLAKNKDTDELHGERVHYDPSHAISLMAKAERVKTANAVPARVSDDPSYYLCSSFNCPSYDICHGGGLALRNCRTCLHAEPVAGGQWSCQRHDRIITIDDQRLGCPSHLYLPSLVPGDQIDADEQQETVTYRLRDGTVWIDGDHDQRRAAA